MADGFSFARDADESQRSATEPPLPEAIAPGDQPAFDELVAAHQERIRRMVHRLLGWSDDAEDVVQEVFLAALTGLKRFRGRSSIGTWLGAIAVNKCRSHRRFRELGLRLLRGFRSTAAPGDTAPQSSLDREETLERVRRAVRSLPAKYREVIVLRYLEEMPIAEVAALTGLSANAVQIRLHRGRRRLRSALTGPGRGIEQ